MLQSPKLGDHVSVIGSRADESPLLGHPGVRGCPISGIRGVQTFGPLVPVIASSKP